MSLTLPTVLPIKKIIPEAEGIKTFVFSHQLDATPGQFVMAWLPRVDEKPFSVWTDDPQKFYLTVSAVGPFSEKFNLLKVGDQVGFRGPFGHGFTIPTKPKKVVLVGGGFGTAPLLYLAQQAKDCEIDFVIGARNKNLLFGEKQAEQTGATVHITTNDGSAGEKGFNTVILEKLIARQKYDIVYSCGPEPMMKRIAEICRDAVVPCELSLERYMKCGFGVCGSCTLDNSGTRVCADGPVFSGKQVLREAEFGKYRRDSCGKRKP